MREALEALLEFMERRKELKSLDPYTRDMLDEALDKVVDGTDNNISLVPGYKRKLYKSIIRSLEYADQMIEQIPRPIDLDSNQFVADPYARAYFHTVSGLKKVCNSSSELRDFFQESENRLASESCALLCMRKREENVLGMQLQGEQVIRDVMQTRVTFANHRIQSPGKDESAARRELKCCIFEGLVDNALANISELRARRRQLETEQRRLSTRLRSQSFVASENELVSLKLITQELHELGYVTPQTSLDQVNSILGHPEEFVSVKSISMVLDKAGIVRSDKQQQHGPARELNFSEVSIKGQPSRVVTLALIKRDELASSEMSFPRVI